MRTKLVRFTWVIVGAAVLLAAVPVLAHHSFAAEYDAKGPVTLKGTIVKMEWVNPHSWLELDVIGHDGKIASWKLELATPNVLYRRGWRRESLQAGLEVTVTAFRAKDGSLTAHAMDVVLPDGRKLFAGSSGGGVLTRRPDRRRQSLWWNPARLPVTETECYATSHEEVFECVLDFFRYWRS